MCIICVKRPGLDMPTREQVEAMLAHNSDGAGFMLAYDDKVYIRKGYKKLKSLEKALRRIEFELCVSLKDVSVVVHARIATHGKVDAQNCHPLPLSKEAKELRSTQIEAKIGFAHNGIFMSFDKDDVLSDSQVMVRDVLAGHSWKFFQQATTLLPRVFSTSRVVLLHGSGALLLHGDYEEEDGLLFSNKTYKEAKIKTPVTIYGGGYSSTPYTRANTSSYPGSVNTNTRGSFRIPPEISTNFLGDKDNWPCDICGAKNKIIYSKMGYNYYLCGDCHKVVTELRANVKKQRFITQKQIPMARA